MGEPLSELVENQVCVAQGWVVSAAGVVMLAQRPCSETCHLACTEAMLTRGPAEDPVARIPGPCWGAGSSDDSRGLEYFSPASLSFRTALQPRPPLPNLPPSLSPSQGSYVHHGLWLASLLLRGLDQHR